MNLNHVKKAWGGERREPSSRQIRSKRPRYQPHHITLQYITSFRAIQNTCDCLCTVTIVHRFLTWLMLSESKILLPSKGIPPGRKGLEPVAIMIFSAFNVVTELSVCVMNSDLVPPESGKDANPSTKETPANSSCRRTSCAFDLARSVQE